MIFLHVRKTCLFFIFVILVIMADSPAVLSADLADDSHVEVELVSEVDAIRLGHPFWLAVRLYMEEGWQIYWKNPGDSGLATAVQWDLPRGFKSGDLHWPFPMRMDYPELTSYGYEGEVMLMARIVPPDGSNILDGDPIQTMKARVTWLSCGKGLCIPGKARIMINLPVSTEDKVSINVTEAAAFDEARGLWPFQGSGWSIVPYDDGPFYKLVITPSEEWAGALTQLDFFPERNDLVEHIAPQRLKVTRRGYELLISKSFVTDELATHLKGVLVSENGWGEGQRKALFIDEDIIYESQ